MGKLFHDKQLSEWLAACPVLADVIAAKPALWMAPHYKPFARAQSQLNFTLAEVEDAAERLERFRPYIAKVFPETAPAQGRIESPLEKAAAMHGKLEKYYELTIPGELYVKLDSHLPISGSIKARGGIYEVLKFAETTAIANGLLKTTDNYALLDSAPCRELFSRYSLVVGSTGNLGLSIGIMGTKLGFRVAVHMSADAKEWKKELLRARGVAVVEHQADYSSAVAVGREQAKNDPLCHFVDDEASHDLFLGYAVASERLKAQFAEQGIRVDEEHPLFVYLPCGVGGGPGGVTFGLKLAFGDNVHCFFGEPTQAPAMLVGLATGLHDGISAQELGIENRTVADGLAVSRPSGLVSRVMEHILTGAFTVRDDEMFRLLALFAQSEQIHLEPSAVVGFAGLTWVEEIFAHLGIPAEKQQYATHLVWATGGSMVPESVRREDYQRGMKLLKTE